MKPQCVKNEKITPLQRLKLDPRTVIYGYDVQFSPPPLTLHVYICVCMNVGVCGYMYMHTNVHVYIHVHMHVCMQVGVCMF